MSRLTSAFLLAAAIVLGVGRAQGDPTPAVVRDPGSNLWRVHLDAMHAKLPLGNGKSVHGWTYDGMVPGPLIVVPEGATVDVSMRNDDPMTDMNHGLDIHAAQIAPEVFSPVATGKALYYRFAAAVPGIYLYHCSADPMLQHVANGMFGAFIVTSKSAPVARSFVIIQNEWYADEDDLADMVVGHAAAVTFNGQIGALVRHPLLARTGELVRFYVLDAGPTHAMAFHIIGALLHEQGAPSADLIQTLGVPPGSGAVVDVRFAGAGRYPIISHSLGDVELGAIGYIDVTDDASSATDSTPVLVR